MVFGITQKIFNTGLLKFSKIENVELEKTQIHITMDDEGNLTYKTAIDYVPKETVTFLQIMDKKMDLLGYKALSTPVIQNSIIIFCNEFKIMLENISVFVTNQNGILYLMIYDEKKFVKHITLKQHLSNMKLE